MKKRIHSIVWFLVISTIIITISFKVLDDRDDFELIKNLEIFHNVMKELKINYVEEIDSRHLITIAINKMVENIDPYTNYYPEASIESFRMLSESQYVGVGIEIDTFNNNIYVTEIENNSISHKEGMQIGDRVVKINNIDTKNITFNEVRNLLSGDISIPLDLQIERNSNLKDFSLKRELVKVQVVSLVEKIDNYGYIKLESFTDKSASEFKTAFLDLKKQKIEGLIIDLRNNPGGLLDQAVTIVNYFVEKDVLVVSSKGKSENSNMTFYTTQKPLDTEIPIVVLVNKGSASASEIVAGALQDFDRAIILGEQTYGKGLVQRIFDVGYNAKLKITISKYYIPSGRCIQAIDYSKFKKDDNNQTKAKFFTKNKRIVYEGLGIQPDVIIDTDTLPEAIKNLVNKRFIFLFANEIFHTLDTASIKSPKNIVYENKDVFTNYLTKVNYFETTIEYIYMQNILKTTNNNEIKSDVKNLQSKIISDQKNNILNNFKILNILISKEIAKRKFLHRGEIEFNLTHDKEIAEAKKYLKDTKNYNKILGNK